MKAKVKVLIALILLTVSIVDMFIMAFVVGFSSTICPECTAMYLISEIYFLLGLLLAGASVAVIYKNCRKI